ncbi:MAG: hypothetical protein ACRD1T_13560 [Acidimicrobiia bacterium]
MWIQNQWVPVDATHDAQLAALGLVVNEWDGEKATRPAYPPIGPILVEGLDDELIRDALSELKVLYKQAPPELA